jgi:protein-L-isoaspartate O-methyltransferase
MGDWLGDFGESFDKNTHLRTQTHADKDMVTTMQTLPRASFLPAQAHETTSVRRVLSDSLKYQTQPQDTQVRDSRVLETEC